MEIGGGTLSLNTPQTIPNPITLQSDLVVLGSLSSTLGGTISSTLPDAGLVLRASPISSGYSSVPATLNLTKIATYIGSTTVDYSPISAELYQGGSISRPGATLVLAEGGALPNSRSIEIRAGGTVTLNGAKGLSRIGDSTPPVNPRSGTLALVIGIDLPDADETIGALSSAGYSTVQTSTSQASKQATLRAAELVRVERGTVEFRGDQLGKTPGPGISNVFFSTPPALTGGSGVGAGVKILPYAVANVGQIYSLATYDPVTGVRPLNPDTEFATLASANASTNVRIQTAVANNAQLAMNALQLDVTSITGVGSLQIMSGALLAVTGGNISNSLIFGATEGNIFTPAGRSLNLTGSLLGTGGLTKSGTGSLSLLGPYRVSGPLTINAGILYVSSLATDSSPVVINGYNAGIGSNGGNTVITRDVEVKTGVAQLRITNGSMVMNGRISGSGGIHVVGANAGTATVNTVVLNGINTYTGPTHVNASVTISGDSAFGVGGDVSFGYGIQQGAPVVASRVTLKGNWTTDRRLQFDAPGTIDTGGFEARWNGPLGGPGALTKTGQGPLVISGANGYSSGIIVDQGSLQFAGNGSLLTSSFYVHSGAGLVLDDSVNVIPDRLPEAVSIALSSADFRVRGNPTLPVMQRFGTTGGAMSTITLERTGTAPVSANFQALSQYFGGLIVRGDDLGGEASVPFTRVNLTNIPPTSGGLVPGTYASSSSTGTRAAFAVYDETIDAAGPVGLRALNDAESTKQAKLSNPNNGGETGFDANFLADGTVTVEGSSNGINSLTLQPGSRIALSAGQSLSIGAPGIFARGGGLPSKITGGMVDVGNAAGLIYTAGEVNISGTISGTAGFQKYGPGKLSVLNMQGILGLTVGQGTMVVNGSVNEWSFRFRVPGRGSGW